MNKGQKGILFITIIIMIGIMFCSFRIYQIANIPTITLNGNRVVTMNLYENYNEEGAQAYRNKKDISNEIKIEGNINTKKPGTYKITYKLDDKILTRDIIVKDNVSPVLTINGSKEVSLEVGTNYVDEGATAEDNIDGIITDNIEVDGTVDTNTIGEYKITYKVKDKAGNEISDVRKIVVKEKSAPAPVPTPEPVIEKVVDTRVKVSIANQTVELYKNNELILSSAIVTGTENYTDSDKGVFKIYSKSQNVYLKGADYLSFVSFWMPYNGGEGLHDATWRNEFGGEIYKTSGSHGCINMPYEVAKEIYSYVEVGTIVEVY